MAFFTPPIVAAAAAGIGAVGSIISGIGQYATSQAQAGADRQNARLAEAQGESEAGLIRERARRARGANVAAIGASGVDLSGSFLDALADSDINAELDAQTALWNRKVEASNYRTRARQARNAGVAGLVGGIMGTGTTTLSGYGDWRVLSARSNAPAPAAPGYPTGSVNSISGMFGHI
jgi:hypothetical protein